VQNIILRATREGTRFPTKLQPTPRIPHLFNISNRGNRGRCRQVCMRVTGSFSRGTEYNYNIKYKIYIKHIKILLSSFNLQLHIPIISFIQFILF